MRRVEYRHRFLATLIASSLGLAAGATLAADKPEMQAPTGMHKDAMTKQEQGASKHSAALDMRASKVIGMKVHNAQGENLGKIDDIIVDVNNERVSYAILAFGGTMGMGSKLFAYPVSLFQPSADRDTLVLNVDKDRLKSAPGFERKNWPDWGEKSAYRSDIERYFGPTVTPKRLPNESLARASVLIGKDVGDRDGKRAGEVKDLVINLGNGKVHYAVLDFDKSWVKADKLLPISLKAFSFPEGQQNDAMLNIARNQLDTSRGFESRKWPDINDPAYQRDLDAYLQRQPGSSTPSGAAGPRREDRN